MDNSQFLESGRLPDQMSSPREKTNKTTALRPKDASIKAPVDPNHLNGLKLYLVFFGVSISYFLILLNSTVVVTVS